MKKPYRLKKRGKIWYCKLPNEPTFHSTGKTVRAKAEEHVLDELNGSKDRLKKVTLKEFTANLFIPGKCTWLKAKESKGKGISGEMARMRRGHLNNHILPAFGKHTFDFITRDIVDQWLISIDNLSNVTKNHILDTMRIIWSEAEKKELITNNTMLRIEKFNKNHNTRDALEKNEISRLFPSSKDKLTEMWGSIELGCFFMLLATTGIRLSEARALTWSDIIDHQSGKCAILIDKAIKNTGQLGKPKNGNSRIVFIFSSLKMLLQEWRIGSTFPNDEELIFPNKNGKPLRRDYCSTIFQDALKNAEIEIDGRNLVSHSLRHTFNTFYRPLLGDETLRQFTGHSSEAMTDHYDHRTADTTINLLGKYGSLMEEEWDKLQIMQTPA